MTTQTIKKKRKVPLAKTKDLRKVATCIVGLDDVLNGGLPAGRTTLVSGGPGSGKSILGLEFLYIKALAGEPGIFVAFEERADAVRKNAMTLGWDLAPLEQAGKFFLMEARVDPESVLSGAFNLKGLTAIIDGKARAMGASLIVIDALDVLLRLFDDPARERNELYALHDWLTDHEMTSVLTVKLSKGKDISSRYEVLDFMADCVMTLDQRVVEQVTTHRARVVKYRGSAFARNEYPFIIGENGIEIIPISTIALQHKAPGKKVTSGNTRLDAILDGGYRRASSVLFTGTAGTGKTTLAATFVRGACERGEKVLYVNFEESQDAMVSNMLSPGIDLRPHLQACRLQISSTMPESMGAEEHLVRLLKILNTFQPDHVVVDAISSCIRMGSVKTSFDFIMRLINICKERGMTIFIINQATGFTEEQEISGVGVSSMVDTVIALRYINAGGEVNRILHVMKSRGSKHSNQFREFLITDNGIDIVDVYVSDGGVLTGVARQEQEAKEAADYLLKQQEIKRKEKTLAQLRASIDAEAVKRKAELIAAEFEVEQLKLAQEVLYNGRNKRGKMRGEDSNSKRIVSIPAKSRGKGIKRKGGAK
jgi:circadian clock protein KaiC